jgi:streptogramin lyase
MDGPAAESASSPSSVAPGDITVGPEGDLWFPELGTNRIGTITMTGLLFRELTVPGAAALGRVIAAGPDRKVWVLGYGLDARVHVWEADTSGVVQEIALLGDSPAPGVGFLPAGITAGPDGNMWVSNFAEILRVSPAGQVRRFPVDAYAIANSITAGADGNLWFVDSIGPFAARRQGLCRITPDGAIDRVLYEAKRQGTSWPSSIVTGADGNLWFADNGYSEVVRVTTNPVSKTVYPLVGPSELAAGPDGNIWVTIPGRRTVARLTSTGLLTEFELPTSRSIPSGIVAALDGNLWFTETDNGVIGRITPDGVITEFAIGSVPRIQIHSSRVSRVVGSR